MDVLKNKQKGEMREIPTTPAKKCSFKLFIEDQCRSLPVKFPFLTPHQIKKKAVEQWNQLTPSEKAAPVTPLSCRRNKHTGGKRGKFFSRVSEESEPPIPLSRQEIPLSPIHFQGGEKTYSAVQSRPRKIEVLSAQTTHLYPDHGILKNCNRSRDKKKSKRRVSFNDHVMKETQPIQPQVHLNEKLLIEEVDSDDASLPDIVSVLPENLHYKDSQNYNIATNINREEEFLTDRICLKKSFVNGTDMNVLDKKPGERGVQIDNSTTAIGKNRRKSKRNLFTRSSAKVIASDFHEDKVMQKNAFSENATDLDVYKFENSAQGPTNVNNIITLLSSRKRKLMDKVKKKCNVNGKPRQKITSKKAQKKLKVAPQESNKCSLEKSNNHLNTATSKRGILKKPMLQKREKGTDTKNRVQQSHYGLRSSPDNMAVNGNRNNESPYPTRLSMKVTEGRNKFKNVHSPKSTLEALTSAGNHRKKNSPTSYKRSTKSPIAMTKQRKKTKAKTNSRGNIQSKQEKRKTLEVIHEENSGNGNVSRVDKKYQCKSGSSIDMNNNTSLEQIQVADESPGLAGIVHESKQSKAVSEKQRLLTHTNAEPRQNLDTGHQGSANTQIQVGKYSLRYRSPFKELHYGKKRPCYYHAATNEQKSVDSVLSNDVYEMDTSETNSPVKNTKSSGLLQNSSKSHPGKKAKDFMSAVSSKCKGIFKGKSKRKSYTVNEDSTLGDSKRTKHKEKYLKDHEKQNRFVAIDEVNKEYSPRKSSQDSISSSQQSFFSVASSDESECERDNQLAELNFQLGNPLNPVKGGTADDTSQDEEMVHLDDEICDEGKKHEHCATEMEDSRTGNNPRNNKRRKECILIETNCETYVEGIPNEQGLMDTDDTTPQENASKNKRRKIENTSAERNNCHDQVYEVSTSEDILTKQNDKSKSINEGRTEIDALKSKVDSVLFEVNNVKTKLKLHEMKSALAENTCEDFSKKECMKVLDVESSPSIGAEMQILACQDRSLDCSTSSFTNQSTMIEESSNTENAVNDHIHKCIAPISGNNCNQTEGIFGLEQKNSELEATFSLQAGSNCVSIITPLTGACKIQDLITPHNAEEIVEKTMKKVVETPKKLKVPIEENTNGPEIDKNMKAKKRLQNIAPVSPKKKVLKSIKKGNEVCDFWSRTENQIEEKCQIKDAGLFDSSSRSSEGSCDNVLDDGLDGGGGSAFLKQSLCSVVATAVKTSMHRCQMDMLQEIEEEEIGRDYFNSQGHLTVTKTLRNLRNIVNMSTPPGHLGKVVGNSSTLCSPLCVSTASPALSGVTQLDSGMTPKVDYSNRAARYFSENENICDSNSIAMNFTSDDTSIASETVVNVVHNTLQEDSVECQQEGSTCSQEAGKIMLPTHDLISEYRQAEEGARNYKENMCNNTELKAKPKQVMQEMEEIEETDQVTSDQPLNQTKPAEEKTLRENNNVPSFNDENLLWDLFDEPKASPCPNISVSRLPNNASLDIDMLSGMGNGEDIFF